ncbi:recombinase family protein [[Clostridium] spiroforme]|nr:recombinase family protein [Thomasclavelia spiroformis]
MKYGYVRVSTKEQHEDRQIMALKELNIEEKYIFVDKISGKEFLRPAYRRLLKKLKAGDLLVVLSIDRLGRNYDEIQKQWQHITKKVKADILVLDMPLLDTSKKEDTDLTGNFISDLVLNILSYVAQIERENIKKRQQEGIKAAKYRGVKFGRPKIEVPVQFENIYYRWINKEISSREASKILGISQGTFLKWSHNKSQNS